MEITKILIIVAIVIILYVLVQYAMSGATTHTSLTSGLQMQVIKASSLQASKTAAGRTNYATSLWFYVDDWNYNYGVYKPLMSRAKGTATQELVSGLNVLTPCPVVVLGATDNTLDIFQTVLPAQGDQVNSININGETISKCSVSNIPIQKWVNLIISVYGRTIDVYLDGKLVRTCILDGIPRVDADADMFITPSLDGKGSFKGWTTDFKYFQTAVNPQQAYDIYKAGFGGSWLSGLLSTEVKVTFSKNGKVEQSYTI